MFTPEFITPELIQTGTASLSLALVAVGVLCAQQKEAIKKRDGEKCQAPWSHTCQGMLTIHHIDPVNGKKYGNGNGHGKPSNPDDPQNLITMCESSHCEMNIGGLEGIYSAEFKRKAKIPILQNFVLWNRWYLV